MTTRLILHCCPSAAEDLALEEAIHLSVEEGRGPNTWRLWQAAAPALILGTGQEARRELNVELAASENVSVVRRHSGGGAVLIGPGAINFSAFYLFKDLPGSETIRGANSAVLRPVLAVLGGFGLQAREAGLADLAVLAADGTLRKIAGTSQARKKHSVLVHGTILADPDWERMELLLRFPSAVPDYRAGRDHRSFLTSLRDYGAPHDLKNFAAALFARLESGIFTLEKPTRDEEARAAQLFREKYATPGWNFRR